MAVHRGWAALRHRLRSIGSRRWQPARPTRRRVLPCWRPEGGGTVADGSRVRHDRLFGGGACQLRRRQACAAILMLALSACAPLPTRVGVHLYAANLIRPDAYLRSHRPRRRRPMVPFPAIGTHDAQLLHAEPQRVRMDAQALRGVSRPVDPPAAPLEDGLDVRALHGVEIVRRVGLRSAPAG